jgi:uncharacterized delta-60 repeat protein
MPDGARDITFGNKSKTFVSFGGGTLFANGAALQDDGKIIVIGSAQTGGYEFDYAMTRINPDGSLDKTFGESGKVTTDFGGNNDFAYGVSFQHNKKIILAGYYNAGNKADLGVVRYNIDGSVDSTFGKKGKSFAALDNSNVDCFSATVQPDDKIVAGCTAYYLSGTRSDYALFRFTPDGKPDVDFGTNGQVITSITNGFDGINQVRINAKGEILVSGSSQNSAGISRLSEARYLTTYQTAPNTVSAINIAAVDKSEKSITVYPNPAKDYVNLKTAWTANEWVNVGIYNVGGKILLNKKYFVASEDDIIKIVLEPTWKAGSYYIKVEGSKTFRTSFVITR